MELQHRYTVDDSIKELKASITRQPLTERACLSKTVINERELGKVPDE